MIEGLTGLFKWGYVGKDGQDVIKRGAGGLLTSLYILMYHESVFYILPQGARATN